jgi:hypothetical protein
MALTKKPNLWPSWRRAPEEVPVEAPVPEPVKSTGAAAVATCAATTSAPDPSPPLSTPPSTPAKFAPDFAPSIALDLVPLTILKIGGSAGVANGLGYRERTNENFATEFLRWIGREHPGIGGLWIAAYDIEASFFPRFQAATGCVHLALGSHLRGLGNVTGKSPHTYTRHRTRPTACFFSRMCACWPSISSSRLLKWHFRPGPTHEIQTEHSPSTQDDGKRLMRTRRISTAC